MTAARSPMTKEFNERAWLAWLVKVRIIIITFLLGIGMIVVRFTRTNIEENLFISVILLWYTIAVFHAVLYQLWDDAKLQARLQVLTDLALATAIVHVSGGIDTSFNFLYPLVIIVSSILLPRRWAYITAALAFIGFGSVLELSYFEVVRSYSITRPDLKSLQAVIVINLMAYMAIAYLASSLAQKLRQVGGELQDKSGELEDLQIQHENVIHSMRGGLITTGLDGRISMVNSPGQKLLDRGGQELLGRPVSEFFRDALPRVNYGPTTGEVRSMTPDGSEKTFGITVSPLRNSDWRVVGYVYTFDDLTEIRRLEREVRMKERLSALGRMAAGIAHEIRNPLASIAGSVQVLSGISTLTEEQRTLVNIVTRESERLDKIISDFLFYSRDKNLKLAPTDIHALVEDTLALVKNHPRAMEGKYEFVTEFGQDTPVADIDGDRMKQVFWNLADNALRAMPSGGTLAVSVRPAGEYWMIGFRDTGHGMDATQLEKIFEPFQSSFDGGTGLGLAIVYQIVQSHNGKITVKSTPQQGTLFEISVKRSARPMRAAEARAAGGVRG